MNGSRPSNGQGWSFSSGYARGYNISSSTRPSSSSSRSRPSSPERRLLEQQQQQLSQQSGPLKHTIRRSQSANMTTTSTFHSNHSNTNTSALRDLTIRTVRPDTSSDDDSLAGQPSPETPPKTPVNRSVHRFDHIRESPEHQQAYAPPIKRAAYSTPTVDKTPALPAFSEYRGRRDMPHSPTGPVYSRETSPARSIAVSMSAVEDYTLDSRAGGFVKPRQRSNPSSSSQTSLISAKSPVHPPHHHAYSAPPIQTQSTSASRGFASPTSSNPSPILHHSITTPNQTYQPKTVSRTPTTAKSINKLTRQRILRPQSSNQTINGNGGRSAESSQGGPDSSLILELMKELRGRMQGLLDWRVGDNMAWTKGLCMINEDTGHLLHMREDNTQHSIVGDLRGCIVRTPGSTSEEGTRIIELTTHSSRQELIIRAPSKEQYNQWLAALICWQTIKPAGPNNKMVRPQVARPPSERRIDRRRNSDAAGSGGTAIIKVSKILLWDRTGISGQHSTSGSHSSEARKSRHNKPIAPGWKSVSAVLQDEGEFKLYNGQSMALISVIQLSQLSRCAIQQLDPSVLGMDYSIAIYPQYTPASSFSTLYPQNPICLAVESRMMYEVWFTLLRAFTVPELYGPAGNLSVTSPRSPLEDRVDASITGLKDNFRVPRSLSLRIIEAKLFSNAVVGNDNGYYVYDKKDTEVYIEVIIDGEVRARTMPRTKGANCFWLEQYEFNELPAQLENVEIVIKQRVVKHKKDKGHNHSNGSFSGGPGLPGDVIGKLDIHFQDMKFDTETESWWPLMSIRNPDERVGEVMLKLRKEELVVLMSEEYRAIHELLNNFSNNLTIEIGNVVSTDLRRLSHTLLKIYQVSGKATDWLMSLAEAEIDGSYKDTSVVGGRFGNRVNSNDSQDTPFDRDAARRDVNRAALTEANILFRGNSLLTKAFELHMKRYGREYMEDTLGDTIKRIVEDNIYCEVDPMKIKDGDDLRHQWKILLSLTKAIWQSIYNTAARCPPEVKKVLHHIRSCVEDRYGEILKGVSYFCVSGFLFLRFFCPAVLNPKLFGLLKDHPVPQAQRTLTLVTKSLQGLANMTAFGVKEPWMEPMNEFVKEHNTELKHFIDMVSTTNSAIPNPAPPSYQTPNQILARLPQASKEGFPSLPFLIDQPRALSRLVTMWLKWHELQSARGPVRLKDDLLRFHEACMVIKDRMAICVERAENAERPSSSMSTKWEEVAEAVVVSPLFNKSSMATLRTGRNGTGSGSASFAEEDHADFLTTGVAAAGKSKLSEIVVGIKRRVRKAGIDGE